MNHFRRVYKPHDKEGGFSENKNGASFVYKRRTDPWQRV